MTIRIYANSRTWKHTLLFLVLGTLISCTATIARPHLVLAALRSHNSSPLANVFLATCVIGCSIDKLSWIAAVSNRLSRSQIAVAVRYFSQKFLAADFDKSLLNRGAVVRADFEKSARQRLLLRHRIPKEL